MTYEERTKLEGELMTSGIFLSDFISSSTYDAVVKILHESKQASTNTLLAVSGPIEARIKYLAQTEREELDMLDNVAVGSLERQAKWMLIRELGARKSEAQFLLKEIQAACASGGEAQSQSEGFYCADWNRCGAICEEQCPPCKKADRAELL